MKRDIVVAVYGTLKNGKADVIPKEGDKYKRRIDYIKGTLKDLGGFPALKLDKEGDLIEVEILHINEQELAHMDRIEGYSEEDKEHTFYDRVKITTQDGTEVSTYEGLFAFKENHRGAIMIPNEGIVSWVKNYADYGWEAE